MKLRAIACLDTLSCETVCSTVIDVDRVADVLHSQITHSLHTKHGMYQSHPRGLNAWNAAGNAVRCAEMCLEMRNVGPQLHQNGMMPKYVNFRQLTTNSECIPVGLPTDGISA